MRPAPKRTIHEWAEAERMVPLGTSPKAGRWRSRVYQRPVMEAITDPANVDGTLYVAASQLGGKTEILLNAIGYGIDSDPCPQIFVTYSVDMAQKLSKTRVAPMIRESPTLRGKVSEARSKDSGNTILEKSYDGGELTMVGANSAGGLSMAPKRRALFDEIDRYPASAGTEGDSIALALMRLEAYWNREAVYVTSPGVRDVSRSWRLWQQSDQREWHVDCPDCSTEQVLDWNHVQWQKDERGNHQPETAVYVCRQCGAAWDDVTRWRAADQGRYRATSTFTGLAGFRISALAIANVELERLVKKWLGAQGNPEELKVFKNTVLVEWWDDQFSTLDEAGLMKRRETLVVLGGRCAVPKACALLTAGVDVQDNRFEVSVYAWGTGEEAWCLEHETIMGDPSNPLTWGAVDEYLLRPFTRELGGLDWIRGACVDTGGHHTQASYDFCGDRFRRMTPDGGRAFVFATKGQAGTGELWPRAPSKVTTKVPLWPLRVDVGKTQIYGRLSIGMPGPGYVHFASVLERPFFDGLTSEKLVTTSHKRTRKPVQKWVMKRDGARNEPLDCAVLALAALKGLEAHGFDLEQEVRRIPTRVIFHPQEVAIRKVAVAPGSKRRASGADSWLGDTRGWLK
jgi:phage terminase large subunit GpA-like protein